MSEAFRFFMHVPPGARRDKKDGPRDAIPYVSIPLHGSERLNRAATEADKSAYKAEWKAFEAAQKAKAAAPAAVKPKG